jgi:hypothetical protein
MAAYGIGVAESGISMAAWRQQRRNGAKWQRQHRKWRKLMWHHRRVAKLENNGASTSINGNKRQAK